MAKKTERCVNKKTNDWGNFPYEDAYSVSWQNSTGFYPEPLPPPISTTAVVTEPTPEPEPEPAKKKGGRPKKTNQPQ